MAVIFALVISVAALALLTTRSHTVRVPDLTGLTVDPNLKVVRTILETHDLVLGDAAVKHCDSNQLPNNVTDQTPAPGTSIPAGTAVAITICHSQLSASPD
jgi:beta-lactam-binding protein with PASTA domain